jgi:hypothetical protein
VLQDELLSAETEAQGEVDVELLPPTSDPRIVLWQGDITRLKVDAIVNAANSALLCAESRLSGLNVQSPTRQRRKSMRWERR